MSRYKIKYEHCRVCTYIEIWAYSASEAWAKADKYINRIVGARLIDVVEL